MRERGGLCPSPPSRKPPNENELDEVSAESSDRPIDFPSEVRTEVAHGIASQRKSITAMEGEILRVTHTRKAGGEGGDSFTSSWSSSSCQSTFSSFPLFFSFARYDHTGLFYLLHPNVYFASCPHLSRLPTSCVPPVGIPQEACYATNKYKYYTFLILFLFIFL